MKNKSFRYTFYFGLLLILIVTSVLTLISVNIYSSLVNTRDSKKKEDSAVVELKIDSTTDIIHDTVYVQKEVIKVIDSPKKKESMISKTTDTIVPTDTIR